MKTMLITGATSGIGEELAQQAAAAGYQVIACGRNEEKLAALSNTPNIQALQFDITSAQDSARALATVEADIAVLNAGACEYVDIDAFETDMFQRVFAANFFGVVNCVNGLLPKLGAGKQLVIVDSMARLMPFTRSQAYGSSKAALHYFTKSLEVDLWDKGVKVQAVSPGFVETPLTDQNDFDMPMMISVERAAKDLLSGIEKGSHSIFFPTRFGWIMRFLHVLPTALQRKLSLYMRNKQ